MSKPNTFRQLSNNVHRLDLSYKANFLLPAIPVSVYLVQDNSRYFLIDCGPPNSENQILQSLAKFFDKEINNEQNSAILSEIDAIILTHYHVDHCGAAKALYELSNQSMHISCHQDEIDFLADLHPTFDNVKSDNWWFKMSKKMIEQPTLGIPGKSHLEIMNSYNINTSSNSSTFNNENTSEEKKCSKMKFCHCPGHTPGHCCFYHEEDRVLIGSDLIINVNKLEFSPAISSPNIKESIENTKILVKSMRGRVDKFFPSHDTSEAGVGIEDVVKLVEKK